MQPKTGVVIFTHGSRRNTGNEILITFVDQIRRQLGHAHIEPCFMELAQPSIPVALQKLVQQGCTHIFGYALFLVPGSHLQEDIPVIFEQTLKNHPGVTWEISPPLLADPRLAEFVAQHIAQALGKS